MVLGGELSLVQCLEVTRQVVDPRSVQELVTETSCLRGTGDRNQLPQRNWIQKPGTSQELVINQLPQGNWRQKPAASEELETETSCLTGTGDRNQLPHRN